MNRMHVAVLRAAGGIGQPVSAIILSAKRAKRASLTDLYTTSSRF
jgi:hypothetical protein